MILLQAIDWKQFAMGDEDWNFLPEVVLRTAIMFFVIVISLRLLGKRGVKQLSVFELVVIIGLGSAAGDPMFYKSVGILPAIIVFSMVVILYTVITYFVGKNEKFEMLVEGRPVSLIKDGEFSIEDFKKEVLGEDEFFSELRLHGVSQLGQVEQAIIESSGNISVFYYPDEEVKPGLPIMPWSMDDSRVEIITAGIYACIFCGNTKQLAPAPQHICAKCRKIKWVPASDRKRVL